MQFVKFVAVQALKTSPVVVKAVAKATVRAVPVVVKPAAQFARGAVTGAPKYIPIAGTQGARTTTITPFLRAGIQTRQAAMYVVKAAAVKGPVTAAKVFVRTITAPARDVISLYYAGGMFYGGFRTMRVVRGATSILERRIDAFLPVVGRNLGRVGLEPTFVRLVATGSRVPLYYAAYVGVRNAIDQAGGVSDYMDATVKNYATSHFDPVPRPVPVVPVPVVATNPVVVGSPVNHGGNLPDRGIVRPSVQVPVSPRGAPIVYSPPRGK